MMRPPWRPGILPLLGVTAWALFGVPTTILAQCAMCGSAAASSPGVARGLAYSIFFLLGMLALMVAWLVALVLRSQARARKGGAPTPTPGGLSIPAPVLPTGHAPAEK